MNINIAPGFISPHISSKSRVLSINNLITELAIKTNAVEKPISLFDFSEYHGTDIEFDQYYSMQNTITLNKTSVHAVIAMKKKLACPPFSATVRSVL
jgi:hypothetical protein